MQNTIDTTLKTRNNFQQEAAGSTYSIKGCVGSLTSKDVNQGFLNSKQHTELVNQVKN